MENTLAKLQRMYNWAWDPNLPCGQMYRALHQTPQTIASLADWQKIPFISKKDLLKFSYHERLGVASSEVDHLRAISGTTGQPLITPRRGNYVSAKNHYNHLITGTLIFLSPHYTYEETVRSLGYNYPVIPLDSSDLKGSVALAKQAGVNHILTPSFLVQALYPIIKNTQLAEDILFMELFGGNLSPEEYNELQETFPNASIHFCYGAVELQALSGYQPNFNFALNTYQPTKNAYWELIDEHDSVIEEVGISGELIITTLSSESVGTPLIRYRVGDMAKITEIKPTGEVVYKILGRKELDFIRVTGGVITTDTIRLALRTLGTAVSTDFEFHYRLKKTKTGLLPEPHLLVVPNRYVTGAEIDNLAKQFAANLYISPTYTYAKGIADGHFLPIKLELVLTFPEKIEKRKRLHNHTI